MVNYILCACFGDNMFVLYNYYIKCIMGMSINIIYCNYKGVASNSYITFSVHYAQ